MQGYPKGEGEGKWNSEEYNLLGCNAEYSGGRMLVALYLLVS
jgi:hypothetical protein